MNKQTKARKEWTKEGRAVRRDGGNEDELMSCWQTLVTLSGKMTAGRSYRKKHKDERLLCRLLIWLSLFNVCSESPHMRGAREKVEQCRSKKGVLERGRAIFWALTEQALPLLIQSPLPTSLRSPKTHCTTHTHTEQIINSALRRNHEALAG